MLKNTNNKELGLIFMNMDHGMVIERAIIP